MVAHVLERLRPQVNSVAINANQQPAAYQPPLRRAGAGRTIARLRRSAGRPGSGPAPLRHRIAADRALRFALPAGRPGRAPARRHAGPRRRPRARRHRRERPAQPAAPGVLPGARRAAQGRGAVGNYLADTGGRRMDGWYKSLKVAEVLFEDADAFRNINTLAELQQLERTLLAAPAAAWRESAWSAAAVAGYDPDALPCATPSASSASFVAPVRASNRCRCAPRWDACWRRHHLADQRAGARQLGDGRLRAARRRPVDAARAGALRVIGIRLRRPALPQTRPGRMRAHHDRRRDAGRLRQRGAAGTGPPPSATTSVTSSPRHHPQPATTAALPAKT
jgi:hypothetical protein